MPDYKSLCAAVTICATLVSIQTHTDTALGQLIWIAQPAQLRGTQQVCQPVVEADTWIFAGQVSACKRQVAGHAEVTSAGCITNWTWKNPGSTWSALKLTCNATQHLSQASVMPSSHRGHGQVKTVGGRQFWNWTCLVFCSSVLSWNVVWTEFCLVSTQFPICNHSVSNIMRTTENCLNLSPIQFISRTGIRRQSCLVRVGGGGELGITFHHHVTHTAFINTCLHFALHTTWVVCYFQSS